MSVVPRRRQALVGLLTLLPLSALGQPKMQMGGVVLLQPESEIAPRVGSVQALAGYIKTLEQVAKRHFEAQDARPRSGYVVIAVKPVQHSNAWFDFSPALTDAESRTLAALLRQAVPMPVSDGPVVFALQLGIAGAPPPTKPMPRVDEWAAEVKKAGKPLPVTELVLRTWRD